MSASIPFTKRRGSKRASRTSRNAQSNHYIVDGREYLVHQLLLEHRRDRYTAQKKLEQIPAMSENSTKVNKAFGKYFSNTKNLPPKCPEGGWAAEMDRRDAAAKVSPSSTTALLKKAEAAFNMRSFKKAKTTALLAKSLLSTSSSSSKQKKARLKKLVKDIDNEMSIWPQTMLGTDFYKAMRKEFKSGELNIDTTVCCDDCSFTNLNALHYAAIQGDVQCVEDLVSLGVAIDIPAFDSENDQGAARSTSHDRYCPAPCSTALAICCWSLAMDTKMKSMYRSAVEGSSLPGLHGMVEAAIRLVHLGANIQAVLHAPVYLDEEMQALHQLNLFGKTAFQLAKISKHQRLIRAMKHFYKLEDVIDQVQCRCGSRRPWLECHAADGTTPFCMETSTGKLLFRYSPLAACPCSNTNKRYYTCCWVDAHAKFQDDESGELEAILEVSGEENSQALQNVINLAKLRMSESDGYPNAPLMPARDAEGRPLDRPMNADELKATQCAMIRKVGLQMLASINPKSKIGDWDPEVFAGTMERIDNYFLWNDVHWRLSKSELLVRVKEWNDALDQYCNGVGLHGDKRKSIVEQHTASPFTVCGSLSCSKIETEVKGHASCSRCKAIAYCGRDCQKEDWKVHKKGCIPA